MSHKLLAAAVGLAALAGAVLPAAAQDAYRPLTVGRHGAPRPSYVPAAPAYDPYHGPAAIVTAPTYLASQAVALPFRVGNAIFPAHDGTPLAVIGAPIELAGRLAQVPFGVVQAPFGGPDPFAF